MKYINKIAIYLIRKIIIVHLKFFKERWQSWSIASDLKSDEFNRLRGFESHSLLYSAIEYYKY